MCGISGVLALQTTLGPQDVGIVQRLNDRQRRRGPDGEGLWISDDKRAALGHRRLAIIDVGLSGAQPMRDATGRWSIAFNGEIYNYQELRHELIAAGRKFLSNSDTEVLINCIAEWGESGLRRLRGMYAFALWDDLAKELWLVRDPFGIKPLYYADSGARLWFASQARALADCAPVNTSRRPAGVAGFYLWGAVPDPFTWWQGVTALPAGHFMRVLPGRGAPKPRSFLAVEEYYSSAPAEPLSSEMLGKAIQDSIAQHFVADVTVGVFLSAGIDSTAIAVLARNAGFALHTVTLAFDEFKGSPQDEAPLAEETARLLGAEHKTVRVSKDEFNDFFEDFIASMDQPTTDGLNTYLVSRAAASVGLKVALSGLGGDELLGGYPSFRQIPKLVAVGARVPWRATVGSAVERIGRPVASLLNLSPKLPACIKYSTDIESAYRLRRHLCLPEELALLSDNGWLDQGMEELASPSADIGWDRKPVLSSHAQISELEVTRYMRMQPLRDTDWASMAHSLEVRVPLLDLPLFEKLAPAIASSRPPTKADLAEVAGDVVTRLAQRPKSGFSTPVARWLGEAGRRQRGLKPWADRVAAAFGAVSQI